MKARVNLTTRMIAKLVCREPLRFKIEPGCDELEVRLLLEKAEPEENCIFCAFDGVFSKVWKATWGKIEKVFDKG